jgi:hypothetical protein
VQGPRNAVNRSISIQKGRQLTDHKIIGTPAEPGNLLALKHGADSPRVIEVMARLVREEVTEQANWITQPIFSDALERYCRVEARARLLSDHIFAVCESQGADKIPVRLWESSVAVDNAACRAAEALGITPLSRSRLALITASGELTAQQLAQLGETGKAIRAKRTAALEALGDAVSTDSEAGDPRED